MITNGTLPEWFYLGFVFQSSSNPSPNIVLGIRDEPLAWLLKNIPTARLPWVIDPLTKMGIPPQFIADTDAHWGYGGSISPLVKKEDGFNIFHLPIPKVEYVVGECEDCNGSGKSEHGSSCLHCLGGGNEIERNFNDLVKLAATLHAFRYVTDNPFDEVIADVMTDERQLLTFASNFDLQRFTLMTKLSPAFANYLRARSNQHLPGVRLAIQRAFCHMMPSYSTRGESLFDARIERNGQLFLKVCDAQLIIDGFDVTASTTRGVDMYTVDASNFQHQVALLAGLAMLTEQVRSNRDMYKKVPADKAA
jgi:hypothetical protein